jgi:hypothetical protein
MLIRQEQLEKALSVCQTALASAKQLSPTDGELLDRLAANIRLVEAQLAERRFE